MFPLLIKVRLLSVWNMARESIQRSPLISAGLTILGIGLFALTFAGFLFFFRLAAQVSALSETAYQVYYFLFLFLLAGSVPFVASTLLHSADYSLLFSAPTSPRSVVAAKLLDATVTNSLQFTALGVPALAACAYALNISLFGWVLLPLLVMLFVLLPALFTALGLLILLAVVGVKRLRSAISAMNGLMAAIVCITIVMEASHLPIRPGQSLTDLQSAAALQSSPVAHWFPSGWFAECLIGSTLPGRPGLILLAQALTKILLLSGGLTALCLMLGERLLSSANLAEEGSEPGGNSATPGAVQGHYGFWRNLFASPVAGLLAKDSKYLYRDSVLLSQMTMPLILFAVPFLLALQNSSLRLSTDSFFFSSVIVGIIVFMQTSILSLSSIGLESRSFWVVMIAPNRSSQLILAKFLLSTLFAGATGTFLTFVSLLVFQGSATVGLIQILFVWLSAAGLSGLGVGLSAVFPRFLYENPAHRVSVWALILGFFASTGYVLVSGILFAVAWVVSSNLPGGNMPLLCYGAAFLLYLALTLLAIFAPLSAGAKRIERYQWEH